MVALLEHPKIKIIFGIPASVLLPENQDSARRKLFATDVQLKSATGTVLVSPIVRLRF